MTILNQQVPFIQAQISHQGWIWRKSQFGWVQRFAVIYQGVIYFFHTHEMSEKFRLLAARGNDSVFLASQVSEDMIALEHCVLTRNDVWEDREWVLQFKIDDHVEMCSGKRCLICLLLLRLLVFFFSCVRVPAQFFSQHLDVCFRSYFCMCVWAPSVVDEAQCTAWVLAVRMARHWFESITDDHPTRKLTGGVGGGDDDGPMLAQNENPLWNLANGRKAGGATGSASAAPEAKAKNKKKKKKAKKVASSSESDSDSDDDVSARKKNAPKSASLRALLQSGVVPQEISMPGPNSARGGGGSRGVSAVFDAGQSAFTMGGQSYATGGYAPQGQLYASLQTPYDPLTGQPYPVAQAQGYAPHGYAPQPQYGAPQGQYAPQGHYLPQDPAYAQPQPQPSYAQAPQNGLQQSPSYAPVPQQSVAPTSSLSRAPSATPKMLSVFLNNPQHM